MKINSIKVADQSMTINKSSMIFGLFLLIFSISVKASVLDGFTEIDPYIRGTKEFSCANYSKDEWRVSVESGKLQISKAIDRNSVTLEVAGGKMTAKDMGEWGGGIEFYGNKSQKIFSENISFLFPFSNSKVAAFGGLSHLGSDDGYMLIIVKPFGTANWKIEKQIKLPANPFAVTIKDGSSFYFVTDEGLYSIDWNTGKSEKLKLTSTSGLYPNSLVVIGGHFYVGMRYAVAHFIPAKKGYKIKWLVKKGC